MIAETALDTFGLDEAAHAVLWHSLEVALEGRGGLRPDVAEVLGHSLGGSRREWERMSDADRTSRAMAFPKVLAAFAGDRDADVAVNGIPLRKWLGIVAEGGFGPFERLHVRVRPRAALRDLKVVGLRLPHLADVCDRTDGVGFFLGLDAGSLDRSPIGREVLAFQAAHAALRHGIRTLLEGQREASDLVGRDWLSDQVRDQPASLALASETTRATNA